jgi:ribonuclease VapC
MVIDTSAIIAYLRSEPEAEAIESLLDRTADLRMSAFTALECRVVLHCRYGPRAAADFDLLVAKAGIRIEPFDDEQSELAFAAYRRFGKGTGHPAGLNLGDCAAYALATSRGLPLLFKGDDFTHTDIVPAHRPA